MELTRATIEQLNEVSEWLEQMQAQPQQHIGYCGTEAHEIFVQMHYDLIDGEETSVVIAKEDDHIVGVMALDVDEESAEVWGPFSTKEGFALEEAMFTELKRLYPHITEFGFYLNKKNVKQQQFVVAQGAEKRGDHLFLVAKKDRFVQSLHIDTVPFDFAYSEQLTALHDTAFPETYYDAATLIRRATRMAHCHLLLVVEAEQVVGYSYFEVDAYTNEASLNYILIDDSQRGKGLGKRLMQEVLAAMFQHEGIEEVKLSVNADNAQAYNMFIQGGFEKRTALSYYTL